MIIWIKISSHNLTCICELLISIIRACHDSYRIFFWKYSTAILFMWIKDSFVFDILTRFACSKREKVLSLRYTPMHLFAMNASIQSEKNLCYFRSFINISIKENGKSREKRSCRSQEDFGRKKPHEIQDEVCCLLFCDVYLPVFRL